ncbi:type VI secretion system secreted protein VgrG, partial [Chitinivorax tropicus]|nr:type VI secretion system secreted protein VgrG [Chitinivorax tropicus]
EIELKGGNITFKARGKFEVKAASIEWDGPGREPAAPLKLPVGQAPKTEMRLDHRYHDDAPVSGAEYEVELADGSKRTGTLDSKGQAILRDVPMGPATVHYGPSSKPYVVKDKRPMPKYNAKPSPDDLDKLTDQYLKPIIKDDKQ